MTEADAHRFERIARQRPQGTDPNACGHLDRLAPEARVLRFHVHVQKHQVASVLQAQLHAGVVQLHVARG
ncbi:hypothetical protein D9M71_832710 [compost metagenome]